MSLQITPVGHRVLVKPDAGEEVTKSGIVIAKKVVDEEQSAQVVGTVLAIGEDAWQEYKEPWAKIGDKVLYQRYAGMKIPDGKGKFRNDLILLNDLDVTARVLEDGK